MSKQSARSVADVSRGEILARVDVAAPPERVWLAVTRDLAKWWGSAETYRTTSHVVDLRPGGRFRSEGVGADGVPFHVEGEVLEVDAPRRYVTTWQPSWSAGSSTVTWQLEPLEAGTRVTVHHAGLTDADSCRSHGDGWELVLGWLASHERPTRRWYLCRLLPPRPTFMLDMSDDERAVMMAHGRYWRGRLEEGAVLAFGPVGGPQGGFGVGLVAAADEAELAAFQAADPAIRSGFGLRYEVSPMVALVY